MHFQKESCIENSKSIYEIPGDEEVFKGSGPGLKYKIKDTTLD